jgi:IS5 family transposase
MFLKFRYRLGYETLCREVKDSITWRRFCRIPLDGQVPHPTTLMKLTTRCGLAAVDGCNEALLAKAVHRCRAPPLAPSSPRATNAIRRRLTRKAIVIPRGRAPGSTGRVLGAESPATPARPRAWFSASQARPCATESGCTRSSVTRNSAGEARRLRGGHQGGGSW